MEKGRREEMKVNYIKSQLNGEKTKVYEAITEKGASNWLNALPLKNHGFYLDKQTFNLDHLKAAGHHQLCRFNNT